MPTVVVGAGIVGASVAYHLARRGLPVTLIDRAPSPAGGVTRDSFAWIGDSGGDWPGGADDLRGSVRADYRRLEGELPAVTVRWTGSLTWTSGSNRRRAGGPPGRGQTWIGRDEIETLEPHLRNPPEQAVYSPTDGGVDPVRVTGALVHAARALGARVILGAAVTSMKVARGHVQGVLSSAGFLPASMVVLAAGTEVGALAGWCGVTLPIAGSPAVLLRVSAPPGLVRTIVAGPEFEAREVRDGHLLLTAPYDDQLSSTALERLAYQTLARLRSTFRHAGSCRLLEWRLADRPMPAGGPLIGHLVPGRSAYVAVTHSAVTLAPTIGRLVAEEIATGTPAAELRRCRPGVRGAIGS